MPADTSPLELVDELHRRQGEMFAGGSIDPVLALLPPDIIWHVPGRSPIAAHHRGIGQVVDYFERRRRLANATMRMRPGEVVSEGDAVAQFVEGRAVLDGEQVSCFNIGPEWPLKTRLLAWGPRMRRRLGPTVAFRLGIRDREAARRSVERILEWDFDRILPGHGEIVETGGKAKFREDVALAPSVMDEIVVIREGASEWGMQCRPTGSMTA